MQIIIYGVRWWLPPSPGHGESNEFVLPVICPNTESASECELTNLLVGLMQERVTKYVVPLPSLISELSPPLVLEARSGTKFQLFSLFNIIGPFLG
jgi:hypothetical protein